MDRTKIAQYISLVATASSVIGFILASSNDIGWLLVGIGFMGSIAAYIFGGFGEALKIAGKIGKAGWFFLPFPIDIFTGIITFIVALYVLMFIPIIPVRMAYNKYH